jgi:hypothetical protein
MRRASLFALALSALSTLPALAPAAHAQYWNGASGYYARGDRDYRDRDDWRGRGYRNELRGDGVGDLYPELRDSGRGRQWVEHEFDFNRDGWIDRREARAANRAFFDLADRNRDGRLTYNEVQYGLNLTDPHHRWTRDERERYGY